MITAHILLLQAGQQLADASGEVMHNVGHLVQFLLDCLLLCVRLDHGAFVLILQRIDLLWHSTWTRRLRVHCLKLQICVH